MEHFNFLNEVEVLNYMTKNGNGVNFGNDVVLLSSLDQLSQCEANFVVFGIPDGLNNLQAIENIDQPSSFDLSIKALVNIQDNLFNQPQNVIILGHINPTHFYEQAKALNSSSDSYQSSLQSIYRQVNQSIAQLTSTIIEAGKTPIIIGGNALYAQGIIEGAASAQGSPVNILNISPTSYFKESLESNSGNQEFLDDFIHRLFVFGLHKNYTSQSAYNRITSHKLAKLHFFEDCLHLTTLDKSVQLKNALDFLKNKFGLEMNLNAIDGMNFNSEAFLGFSVRDIRTFIKLIRKEQVDYVHFSINNRTHNERLGKSLSYLISDFLRQES
jgi:formiminoglutamase